MVHEARPVLITRNFILLFTAHLLFGLSFWPYVLLPVFLQQRGADLFTVGVIMGTASFSGILIRPWVGAALDRIGRWKILIALFWPTPSGLIVSGVLSGIGHGFIFPILSVMLIERARKENRGSAITLFTMLYDFGLFIGAPLLGFIAMGDRYGRMYAAAAVVLIVSLIAFIRFDRERGEGESGPPLRGGGG